MIDRRQVGRIALAATVALAACRSNAPGPQRLSDEEIIANKPAGTNAIIVHGLGYGRATIEIAGATPTCQSFEFEDSHYSQTCWAYVAVGSSVTLSVLPVGGAVFLGWETAPCSASTASTCEVPMDVDRIIGVKVDPGGAVRPASEYRLTVRVLGFVDGDVAFSASPAPPGGAALACQSLDVEDRVSVRQQCGVTLPAGTVVTLTPSPRAGTSFVGWGGACSGTEPCTVTMGGDRGVTAAFASGSGPAPRPPDAAALIGPAGGTVRVESSTSPLHGVSLTFPAGSFVVDTLVTITHRPDVAAPIAGASRQAFSLPSFEIAPAFEGLPAPATLRIPVPDVDGDGIVDGTDFPVENAQLFFRRDGASGWERAEAAVTPDRQAIELLTTHASQWQPWYWRWQRNTCVRYAIRNDPGLPARTASFDPTLAHTELQQAFDAWSERVAGYGVRFSTNCAGTLRAGETVSTETVFVGLEDRIAASMAAAVNWGISPYFDPLHDPSVVGTVLLKINPASSFATAPYAVDPPFASALHPWFRTLLHEAGHLMGLPDYSILNADLTPNTLSPWNRCSLYSDSWLAPAQRTWFHLPDGVVMWYDACVGGLPLVRLHGWDRVAVGRHYRLLPIPIALLDPTVLSTLPVGNCWFANPAHAVFTTAAGKTWIASGEHHYCDPGTSKTDTVVVHSWTGSGRWSSEAAYRFSYAPTTVQPWGAGIPGAITMAQSSSGDPHILVNTRTGSGTWYWGPDRAVYLRPSSGSWVSTENVVNDEGLQRAEGNASGAQYSGFSSFSLASDPGADVLHLLAADGAWWATRNHAASSSAPVGSSTWSALTALYTATGIVDRGAVGGASQDLRAGAGIQVWLDSPACALRGRRASGGSWEATGSISQPLGFPTCSADANNHWGINMSSQSILSATGVPTIFVASQPRLSESQVTLRRLQLQGTSWLVSDDLVTTWTRAGQEAWRAFDAANGRRYVLHVGPNGRNIRLYDVAANQDTLLLPTEGTIGFIDAERHSPKALVWAESDGTRWTLRVAELQYPVGLPATPAPAPAPAPTPTFTRLTTDASRDIAPVWRPSGDLLFQSNRGNARTNTNDVWRMNADGSGQQKVVQVNVTTPSSWGDPGLGAPVELLGSTGDLVVYEAQYFHEIMRVRLSQATTFPIVRTAQDGNDGFFSRVLFVPGGQGANNVVYHEGTGRAAWVAHTPGGHQIRSAAFTSLTGQNTDSYGTQLTSVGTAGWIQSISYSPDGTKIAAAMCTTCNTTTRPDIYVLDAASGAVLQRVTTSGATGVENTSPRWSPRGDRIAFEVTRAGQRNVWLGSPTGTPAPTELVTPVPAYWPAWSPDGASLAFVGIGADGNEDVWIARDVVR